MSSVLESLLGNLQGPALNQMAQQLGADESSVQKAVTAALPLILGGMAKNSASDQGANALLGALQRDHDGSVLNNVAGFLGGGGSQKDGLAILNHIFGNREPAAEEAVSKASGLDLAKVGPLMAMLAPLVMGALGREQRSKGLNAGQLAGLLLGERQQANSGVAGQLLSMFLDQGGSGNKNSGLANAAGSILGKLMGGSRQ